MPTVTTQVLVPTTEQVKVETFSGESFDSLVSLRQNIVARIKELQLQKSELDSKIGAALDINSLKNIVCGDFMVTRGDPRSGNKKVDPQRLLQLGVSPTTIQAATVVGKMGLPTVRITNLKGGDEEQGDGQW